MEEPLPVARFRAPSVGIRQPITGRWQAPVEESTRRVRTSPAGVKTRASRECPQHLAVETRASRECPHHLAVKTRASREGRQLLAVEARAPCVYPQHLAVLRGTQRVKNPPRAVLQPTGAAMQLTHAAATRTRDVDASTAAVPLRPPSAEDRMRGVNHPMRSVDNRTRRVVMTSRHVGFLSPSGGRSAGDVMQLRPTFRTEDVTMRAVDKNRLQVLRRVRDFLTPMSDDPKLSVVFAELEKLIDRVTAEGERQERYQRQAQSATVSVSALAQELREDVLGPLAKLVTRVAKGTLVDGKPIEAALALPRERDHQGLISAANAIHALAKPHEEKLVAAGLPKDLLDEVQQVSAALKTAIDARAQHYLNRSHARMQGITESRNAGDLLRLINALMRKQLRGNAAMRRAWGQAKRMGTSSGGGGDAGNGAVEAPTLVTGPVAGGAREAAEGGAGEVARAA